MIIFGKKLIKKTQNDLERKLIIDQKRKLMYERKMIIETQNDLERKLIFDQERKTEINQKNAN